MKSIFNPSALLAIAAASAALSMSAPAMAFDAAAAETLARREGCLKCHAVAKAKDGPSYKEVAAKYKGKADAEQKLVKHIQSGETAKFPDGHEEEHKIIKTKDQDKIKNMIQWILSQ